MSAQIETNERRTDTRYEFHQKVHLQDDDSLFGYAENLNLGGMLVITEQPVITLEHYDLWFGADREETPCKRIFVSAYPVWQKPDAANKRFYSGMRFTFLDEHTVDKIQQLFQYLPLAHDFDY